MRKFAPVIVIAIAAFIVRAIGINYGLPFAYHDDEPILVNYALAYGTGDFNPRLFHIAPLLTYILFFLYGLFFIVGHIMGQFPHLKDFAYLYLTNPAPFFIIARIACGLLFGTGSVILIYILGRRYFDNITALLAAFFLAFNFLHARDSHYAYFDIPLTFFVILFFIKARDFFQHTVRKDYIQLGALFGLAISVKYQGCLLILPLILTLIYNIRLSKDKSAAVKSADILWCLAASAAVMFAANPFAFIYFTKFIKTASRLPYMPVGPLFHLEVSLFNGCGTGLVITGIISLLFYLLVRKKKESILFASFVIFYYAVMVRATQPAERLMMPVVPIIILFASAFIIHIYNSIKNKKVSLIAVTTAIFILAWPSLIRVYLSDRLFLSGDTRTEAYRWVKENIHKGARIAIDATASWFPRLERSKDQIKDLAGYFDKTSFRKPAGADAMKMKFMLENPLYPEKTYYLYYLRERMTRGFLSIYPGIPVDYQELADNKIEYVILSQLLMDKSREDFVRKVEREALLLKTFSPYRKGIERMAPEEKTALPAAAFMERELLDRKSYGPVIKIYRLAR